MSSRTIALEDLTNRQATEAVQQVARQRESLTVLLSDGSSVESGRRGDVLLCTPPAALLLPSRLESNEY